MKLIYKDYLIEKEKPKVDRVRLFKGDEFVGDYFEIEDAIDMIICLELERVGTMTVAEYYDKEALLRNDIKVWMDW